MQNFISKRLNVHFIALRRKWKQYNKRTRQSMKYHTTTIRTQTPVVCLYFFLFRLHCSNWWSSISFAHTHTLTDSDDIQFLVVGRKPEQRTHGKWLMIIGRRWRRSHHHLLVVYTSHPSLHFTSGLVETLNSTVLRTQRNTHTAWARVRVGRRERNRKCEVRSASDWNSVLCFEWDLGLEMRALEDYQSEINVKSE